MEPRVIIVIEDDQCIRETYQEALDAEGYEVHSFANGLEAMKGIPALNRPALILLDWMMPVMNGEQFLKAKEQNQVLPATPIVVISAQAKAIGEVRGAQACLGKPIDLEELIDTVRTFSSAAGA